MRVFVRLPSGLVPTFDLPDDSTVGALKEMIVLSGQLQEQTPEARGTEYQELRLLVRDVQLDDTRRLQEYTPEDCEKRYLHAVLRTSVATTVRRASAEACVPAPGCVDSSIDTLVQFRAHGSSANWVLEVCATKGSLLAGTTTIDTFEGETYVQWVPSTGLLPDTVHTVYATNSNDSEECSWCFKTTKLSPIRLLVTDGDPNDARLVSIDRKSALVAELHSRILSRFGLSSEAVQIAELQLTREHVNRMVRSEIDVAALQEFDSLRFSTEPATQTPVPATMTRAEYLKEHWVNESAGFYALCGKMSVEEENRRLLEIVQAFDVPEVDCDVNSGTVAEAINVDSLSPSVTCRCGVEDDPTLTVVPAELVRPLWGVSADSDSTLPGGANSCAPLLQEETITEANACWLSGQELDGQLRQQAEELVGQLLERGFAVVKLGAATTADHSNLMVSAGEDPCKSVL